MAQINTVYDLVVHLTQECSDLPQGLSTPVTGYYKGEEGPLEGIYTSLKEDDDLNPILETARIVIAVRS